jgi:putative phage-type endonuclease
VTQLQTYPFANRVVNLGNRDAWRAHRKHSVGGSSAATLAGINPWQLRDELWYQLVGRLEPDDISQKECVYWGTRLEGILLEEVAKETGFEVIPWDQSCIVKHSKCDWIHDTPDGLSWMDEGLTLIQIKTTSAYKADDWKEEPPVEVFTQVQHELEVLDIERAIVGVLIGGQQFKLFKVDRDREIGDWLFARATEFLGWVEDQIEPPHDSRYPMTIGLAKRIYTKPERETVALDPGFVSLDDRRVELDQAIKAATEERDQINERIRRAIGNANCGALSNGVLYKIISNGQMRRSG